MTTTPHDPNANPGPADASGQELRTNADDPRVAEPTDGTQPGVGSENSGDRSFNPGPDENEIR